MALGHGRAGELQLLGEVGQEEDEGVVGHGRTVARASRGLKEAGMASNEVVTFVERVLKAGDRSAAAKKAWETIRARMGGAAAPAAGKPKSTLARTQADKRDMGAEGGGRGEVQRRTAIGGSEMSRYFTADGQPKVALTDQLDAADRAAGLGRAPKIEAAVKRVRAAARAKTKISAADLSAILRFNRG